LKSSTTRPYQEINSYHRLRNTHCYSKHHTTEDRSTALFLCGKVEEGDKERNQDSSGHGVDQQICIFANYSGCLSFMQIRRECLHPALATMRTNCSITATSAGENEVASVAIIVVARN
jgi:hypothetical protein